MNDTMVNVLTAFYAPINSHNLHMKTACMLCVAMYRRDNAKEVYFGSPIAYRRELRCMCLIDNEAILPFAIVFNPERGAVALVREIVAVV